MEILIAIILTLRAGQFSPFGELLSFILVCFSLFVFCVQIPFSYFMLFCHKKQVIEEDEKFNLAYGVLVKGIKLDTVLQRLYFVISLIRRTVFLIVALYFPEQPLIYHLFCLYITSFAALLYYGYCTPLKSRFDRRIEIFNEFMVGLSCLSLFPLTDWN